MSKDKNHSEHGRSGGMGGLNGGPLHDVGSAQSGMIGGAGTGGKTEREPQRQDSQQSARPDEQAQIEDDDIGLDETAEVQQSAQRQGMGRNPGSGNRN